MSCITNALVQPLFDGPLDIVGDVHGEVHALGELMARLGYDAEGRHEAGRRLVFVGDLTDRGPDSPAVVELVERLSRSGRAQCVLGNHDLNILLDHPKHENGWFYGKPFVARGEVVPQRLADAATRRQVLSFFDSLPIALERDDLRVVHACWDDDMISFARRATSVAALYHEHADRIEHDAKYRPRLDAIDKGLLHQNKNPVKLLTSGPECRAERPLLTGGKVRHEQRVPWWTEYDGRFCVFGHYSLAEGSERGNGAAFCVDYGVGRRWTERRAGQRRGFRKRLAALRWPEKTVVFDECSGA